MNTANAPKIPDVLRALFDLDRRDESPDKADVNVRTQQRKNTMKIQMLNLLSSHSYFYYMVRIPYNIDTVIGGHSCTVTRARVNIQGGPFVVSA